MPNYGTITTFAGTGAPDYTGDGGPAPLAGLNNPFTLAFDGEGRLYVADTGNHVVRCVNPEGRITTVAGTGKPGSAGDGGPAARATLNEPVAIAIDRKDALYIVERTGRRIRRVDGETNIITTIAGDGIAAGDGAGDGGAATLARFREPHDIALDWKKGLIICDVGDGRVRRINLQNGRIETVLKGLRGPRAVAVDIEEELLYICEREGNRVLRLAGAFQAQKVTTFAGTGARGDKGDGGPATGATLNGPKGIAQDRDGNLFIVDTENHAIRMVDAKTGILQLVAGGREAQGAKGNRGNGRLKRPHGMAFDGRGNLYIADTENHRVRRVALIRG